MASQVVEPWQRWEMGLQEFQEEHPNFRIKELVRIYVWWIGIDRDTGMCAHLISVSFNHLINQQLPIKVFCTKILDINGHIQMMRSVLDDCCVQLLIIMDGERNHSMGVRWTGLPHSPKTDSDRPIKDNWGRYCP